MNNIGKFIKELRFEKDWTQENLANKIHISREAISKWERGHSIPDIDTLKILSEIFNVSIDELLSGERNPKENVGFKFCKENIKIRKRINILISIMILLIRAFLSYYFINQYKKVNIYTITAEGKNFNVESGIFIKTNEKIYFVISNIYTKEDYEISKVELLYNEDVILSTSASSILFSDYKGYEEYFDFQYINKIINNLYLKIYYDDTYEVIRLNFTKDYVNSNLFFKKETSISNGTIIDNYANNDDYILKIKDIYEEKNDVYFCIYDDININYLESGNIIVLTVNSNDQFIEEYFYYVDYDLLNYNDYYADLSIYCTESSDVCEEFFTKIAESFSKCN